MKSIMKRMLSGVAVAAVALLGGVAEAGTVSTTLELVDGAGDVKSVAQVVSNQLLPICIVISPSDNASLGRENGHPCLLLGILKDRGVVISPSDNAATRISSVVISPSDNVVISPSDNVVISPSDNVVISPSDNVVISPSDNLCGESVVISPSDNRTVRPCKQSVVISPSDNLADFRWAVATDAAGRSAVIDLAAPAKRVDLTARSTVQAQAALALIDLGVRADEIDLKVLGQATSSLASDRAASAKINAAAELAVDRWENGECGAGGSLADRLCGALR